MEEDPAWCSAEDSEEEEMELSSSLDSDKDSDQEEVHLSDKVPRYQQREPLHSRRQTSKGKAKRRKWYGDIPFSSHRSKNPSQRSLGGTSHSYPVTSLRREEDAGIFSSYHSPHFTTFSTISRPPTIPKFTLSNLRANKQSTTTPPSLTRRAALPNRLATQSSSSIPTFPSSPSSSLTSSASPSNLPTSFRSCFKRRKEGDSSQTKKQVLLKLENSVIVPPSSSYEEPQVIDTSAIFAPRSPPLDDDEFSEMSYVPGNQGGYASDEESYCDSPPASLLKELSQTPELEQPAAAPQPAISGKATSPNTSQPRAIASKSADKVSDSDSATSSDKKKKTSRSAEAYFQERIEANRDAKFKAGPMDVPSTSDKVPRLHPRLGEKRESSSSLASEAPSLKQTRSDLSHNNVFLFDEEIHRYQGAGPDRDEEVLLMKSRDKKGKGKDSESDMDPYRKN